MNNLRKDKMNKVENVNATPLSAEVGTPTPDLQQRTDFVRAGRSFNPDVIKREVEEHMDKKEHTVEYYEDETMGTTYIIRQKKT